MLEELLEERGTEHVCTGTDQGKNGNQYQRAKALPGDYAQRRLHPHGFRGGAFADLFS